MNLLKRNFENYSDVKCTRCRNNYSLPNRFKLLCKYHPHILDKKTRKYPCCLLGRGAEGCKRRVHTDLPLESFHKEKPIEIIEKPSKEYDFFMKYNKDSMLSVRWMSISSKEIKNDIFMKLNDGFRNNNNNNNNQNNDDEEEWERINVEDYLFKFDEGLPNEVEEGRRVINAEEDKSEIIEELIKKNPKVCFSYDEILQGESEDEDTDNTMVTNKHGSNHKPDLLSMDTKFGKKTEFILIAKNDVLTVGRPRTSLRKE